jgi:predicted MPP superfamily phosphohydrolase
MTLLFFIKRIFPAILISAGFFILDMVWIHALPTLDLSFGRSRTPYIIFFLIRSCLFLIWFALLLALLSNPGLIIPPAYIWALILPNLLVLALGLYGFCYEPFHLTVSRLSVPVPGLERPVRIVQLSDIHVEYTTQRERDLPPLVASLNPDLIVMTGDYVNESYFSDPKTINDLRVLLSQLHAPLGIYAINGNIEAPLDMAEWFQGLDIHILDDQVVKVPAISPHFSLVGVSFFKWRDNDLALTSVMRQVDPQDFSLLLYHKPDIIYTAAAEHVNLFLAGHTHGGQIRLPFYGALVTNSKYGKRFEMGLYHVDQTTLFVSRGLGFTGGVAPRIRFLAPPEVVVIDLVPEKGH